MQTIQKRSFPHKNYFDGQVLIFRAKIMKSGNVPVSNFNVCHTKQKGEDFV
jgi:hypothetical protein